MRSPFLGYGCGAPVARGPGAWSRPARADPSGSGESGWRAGPALQAGLREETRGAPRGASLALGGLGDDQPLFGARDRDVEHAALLLEVAAGVVLQRPP